MLALAMIVAAPALWRGRRTLREPVIALAAALFASLVISTIAAGDGVPVNIAGRLTVQMALVLVGAAVWGEALAGARPLVERAAFAVALAATVVTLVGGALAVAQLTPGFTDTVPHPTFGSWPRLVGGFSESAETCGLVMIAAAAVLLRRRILFWLPAIAAIGTLAIGGAGIAFAAALRMKRLRAIAIVGAAVAIVAIQWPVHTAREAPCDEYSNIIVQSHAPDGTCTTRPYTRYTLAKLHSLELAEEHPVLGAGALGFRRHAEADRSVDFPYYTTHGAWHGIAAEQGLVGLALAIALAIAVARALHRGRADPAALAIAALLLGYLAASIDLDVHKQRLLWLAIGASAGLSRARA